MKKPKALGLFNLVMAGYGGAFGFEIFVLLNYAYFHLAGPEVIIALLLAGIINILIILSYSELSAAMPKVGGEYTYLKTAYGGTIAFISGCFRWLASIFGAALAGVALALQLAYLFSFFAPDIQNFILTQLPLMAALIVIVYVALDVRGLKKIGDIVNILLIVVFISLFIGGLIHGLGPIEFGSKPALESFSGIFAATVYVFPMFFGTRAIIASAASAKRPGKDIPRSLIITAITIIPLYICLAIVAMGIVAPAESGISVPLISYAAERIFGTVGGIVFAIAGIAACVSGLGTAIDVQSSIIRGMSRDGYFPKILLRIHARFGTNYVAVITGSLFILFLSMLGNVPLLGYAASFGSLFVFALVNLSLIKLRKTKPYIDRPFKTPLYPLTPILGIFFSVALLFIPLFLGDSNASDALISSIGITALVIATYYLRMTGRYRAQIALGGIGMGIGISLAIMSILNFGGIVNPIISFIPSYIQFILSVVLILAGYFNFNAGAKKKKPKSQTDEQAQTVI